VFTGRPARALRNRLIDEMADAEALEFPAQASLTRALLQANSDVARRAFLPLWAGQAASLIRDQPAATLIDTLVTETRRRLPSR
jgi:nitronate monooxygenase